MKKNKNEPRLSLTDLLCRRKMSLEQFAKEFGITTYEMLCIRCERMGVSPPTNEVFKDVFGDAVVSSPTEGIVVLEPIPVVHESTGEVLEPDEIVIEQSPTKPKRRKKSETLPQE
jgi:hypothetical protein